MGILLYRAPRACHFMSFLARLSHVIARWLALSRPDRKIAQQLMEGAQHRAGRSARQARELRRAARAYLSVVR